MNYTKNSLQLWNRAGEDLKMSLHFPDKNGIKQLIIYYKTKLAKTYSAYFSIKEDLELSRNFIQNFLALESNEANLHLRRSLWQSSIITYAKCFADASQKRKTKLDETDCLDLENQNELYQLHRNIINARNNYFAHGGETELQEYEFLLLLNNSIDEKKINAATVATRNINDIGNEYMEAFLELNKIISNKVEEKISKMLEKLKIEGNAVPVEYFYSLLESGVSVYDENNLYQKTEP